MKNIMFLSLFLVGIIANLNAVTTIKVSDLLNADLPKEISGQVIIQNDITHDIELGYETPESQFNWIDNIAVNNNSQQLGSEGAQLKLTTIMVRFKVSNLLNKTMPMMLNKLGKSIRVNNDTEQDVELGYKRIGYETEYKIEIEHGRNWGTQSVLEFSSIKTIEMPPAAN